MLWHSINLDTNLEDTKKKYSSHLQHTEEHRRTGIQWMDVHSWTTREKEASPQPCLPELTCWWDFGRLPRKLLSQIFKEEFMLEKSNKWWDSRGAGMWNAEAEVNKLEENANNPAASQDNIKSMVANHCRWGKRTLHSFKKHPGTYNGKAQVDLFRIQE